MGLLSRAANSTAEPVFSKTEASQKEADPNTLVGQITQYYKTYNYFNCILFEIPGAWDNEIDFCQMITKILDRTGTVISMPDGRPLILLPKTFDRELIAHRISKKFDAAPIFSFEADSPESLIKRIQSIP